MNALEKRAPKQPLIRTLACTLLVFLLGLSLIGCGSQAKSSDEAAVQEKEQATEELTAAEQATEQTEANDATPAEPEVPADVPADYANALRQADSYSKTLHMSKQGIYDQLTSEYGGQFSAEAAQYADVS